MPSIADHPLRYSLTNELHARPAPVIPVPGTVAFLAIKPEKDAAARDRDRDRAHLEALLDRSGATHPAPGATHHGCKLGRHGLKWESHTEFVSYTGFAAGLPQRPFDPAVFDLYPQDWLEAAPGVRITSVLIQLAELPADAADGTDPSISAWLGDWFVGESLAVSWAVDEAVLVASDFRIDPAGHIRMAVFVRAGTGPQRVGRVVQRLCEIETYKTMSMLGLARVRQISAEMGALDRRMGALISDMAAGMPRPEASLDSLMGVSAELERLQTSTSFRFGATRAYEALVHARIEVLRETRFQGRQTLAEFMQRRFDPAMRTVKAAETRLAGMSERAIRAARLLSTQVEVARSAQNQDLLQSMDRRADLQLRLQRTVEGLSVVAISYYGVNLAANIAMPLVEPMGIGRTLVMAGLTPFVILLVWFVVRRLRRMLH
ncbi:DUF3422 domain-containing protein [Pararhodobacter sp. SW119]|uniref:DUF3422 family protein n=1 Tax=Pararhodobacter sp. SW119 TaxID=2780075 RepID=UPI001AE051B4|nr:DUF3422 domain-containing protein [Pararhodobacter sp. SW119]